MPIAFLRKAQRYLWYSTLFLLPTQLGKHFWPSFSFVKGVASDYLSPTVYSTDVLIAVLFLITCVLWIKNKKINNNAWWNTNRFWYCVVVGWIVFTLFTVEYPLLSSYGFLKLSEYVFFGMLSKHLLSSGLISPYIVAAMLGATVIYEVFLAVAQFVNQGSINGAFYFVGERFFTADTLGIANASIQGELILRPYATFSHPNVLAGYLLLVMILLAGISVTRVSTKGKFWYWILMGVGTTGLLLSMSRIAWVLWVFFLVFWLVKDKLKINTWFLVLILGTGSILFALTPLGNRFFEFSLAEESVVYRQKLIGAAIAMAQQHVISGVGLYHFLHNLPFYFSSSTVFFVQPVHSVFLLLASELGIVGLGVILLFFVKTIRRIVGTSSERLFVPKFFLWWLLTAFLVLGLFDHYFYTLQQGQLLTAFLGGVCWAVRNRK